MGIWNGFDNSVLICETVPLSEMYQADFSSPPSTAPHEWAEAGEPDPSDEEIWKALFDHVPAMLSLAKSYDIKILMLQPLNQFEGWAAGSKRADWCRRKAEKWMPLCSALGVEQIQASLFSLSKRRCQHWNRSARTTYCLPILKMRRSQKTCDGSLSSHPS